MTETSERRECIDIELKMDRTGEVERKVKGKKEG